MVDTPTPGKGTSARPRVNVTSSRETAGSTKAVACVFEVDLRSIGLKQLRAQQLQWLAKQYEEQLHRNDFMDVDLLVFADPTGTLGVSWWLNRQRVGPPSNGRGSALRPGTPRRFQRKF